MGGQPTYGATPVQPIGRYIPIGPAHLLLALSLLGCAGPSLMPASQAAAVRQREKALASNAEAIHAVIGQSGRAGGLAFLDAADGRLVVLPGDTPADAWARHAAAPAGEGARVSAPSVLTFVYRANVPKAPEAVTLTDLQQQQELRRMVATLDADVRGAYAQIEERLGMVQRELAAAVTASKQEADVSMAAARADLQKAVAALADDLAAVRKSMLQTAQLGWLTHEATVENSSGLRKVATASQDLAASSAKLEETVRQLSATLASQLKELARRLDNIQGKASSLQ